ncbi:hypothetical protein BpHYR1_011201 [Brachionus plicatilis]|uniref:Uncharacterized protein n=1 Tax=Brachionus plicatilis TaxID=10195 RepID=A0A3M7SNF8_BRAPC|nr:hypothetical protein BpHYR1_011201 [Brachionus plicatilis]
MATARLACGGVPHERTPMVAQLINNKIVCGAYGTVVWVQDRTASYRFLNWFTEVALTTEAGRAFHSLTTLFVNTLDGGLAGQSSRMTFDASGRSVTCECDSQILFGIDESERAPGIILTHM